ncbi:MAG: inositol monophosphatase family protein [Candidatus Paceibacteria bacterium]
MEPYDFIVAQVRAAGDILLRLREEKFETLEKGGDPRDIVTSVDLTVNDFLIGKIKEAFPGDSIYSEEGGGIAGKERLWTIDPIDGSSNFSRGIPHFAICLAFLKNGTPEAGAVYNPVSGELFSFKRGGGAFLNGKSIQVSAETELKNAFVFLHAGRKPELWSWGGESYTKLLSAAKKTANYGGSALDACFVAAGRIEANIYGRLTTLDIAAAIGILLEAGGRVVDEKGQSVAFSGEPTKVIMTNSPEIERSILDLLF